MIYNVKQKIPTAICRRDFLLCLPFVVCVLILNQIRFLSFANHTVLCYNRIIDSVPEAAESNN